VNTEAYDPAKHKILSAASCTTNCLAPTAKVLLDTVRHREGPDDHGAQLHQRPAHPRPDPQGSARARAAALSMIPTSTGAAKAIGDVLPR
jgi:glyceraldehyde 3-phosphate dehydrogenase